MTNWILKGIYQMFGIKPIYNVLSQNCKRNRYWIKLDNGTIRRKLEHEYTDRERINLIRAEKNFVVNYDKT